MAGKARIVKMRHAATTEQNNPEAASSEYGLQTSLCQRVAPSASLSDVVESLWLQRAPASSANGESGVLPTGTVEILFNYGDRFGHIEPDGLVRMPRSYLTGQRTRRVHPVCTGRVGIVIASVYPWGVDTLFPAGVVATDGYVDVKQLTQPCRVTELEERLSLARRDHERVRLVEAFLIRERADRLFDERIALASQLLARPTEHPVWETARALSISPRHLSRSFKAAVGLSPKLFARIMRFQRALQLRRRSNASWASIAVDCGCSDQAHLIHEMRRFASSTPSNITLERSSLDDAFNGEDASRFFDTVYL